MMTHILMEVLAGAVVFCTVVVAVGLRRRREWLDRQGRPTFPDRFELSQTPLASGIIDVASELGQVLRQLDHQAARQFVVLELAVEAGLAVRADRRAIREILHDLITNAIDHSPCGRVLVAAARIAGWAQLTVSDDAAAANRPLRASQLRSAERLAALQGATMDIDTREGRGTTVILRLPGIVNGVRRSGFPESLSPAGARNLALPQENGPARQ